MNAIRDIYEGISSTFILDEEILNELTTEDVCILIYLCISRRCNIKISQTITSCIDCNVSCIFVKKHYKNMHLLIMLFISAQYEMIASTRFTKALYLSVPITCNYDFIEYAKHYGIKDSLIGQNIIKIFNLYDPDVEIIDNNIKNYLTYSQKSARNI